MPGHLDGGLPDEHIGGMDDRHITLPGGIAAAYGPDTHFRGMTHVTRVTTMYRGDTFIAFSYGRGRARLFGTLFRALLLRFMPGLSTLLPGRMFRRFHFITTPVEDARAQITP